MNLETIKKGLSGYDKVRVGMYLNYLKTMSKEKKKDGSLKYPWINYLKDQQLVDCFKKVSIDKLYIDGDSITLTFKGKLMVSYDYQAYKNKVLSVYPETIFDFQLVYKGDTFSFEKKNGKIFYAHNINNPFKNDKEVIGAYGILKNSRGEFIETINIADINKIKASAKTQQIWDTWFDRMVLKTIIKRICKIVFKDEFKNIETIDNENYDLSSKVSENEDIDSLVKEAIEIAETLEELQKIFNTNKDKVSNEVNFISLLGARKEEIKKTKIKKYK